MITTETPEALLSALPASIEVDTSTWVHVGGTGAGGYFRAAIDVLVAVPRPRYIQREADARRSLEEFHRIARDVGRPQSVIILVDQVAAQDASSRRVWSENPEPSLRRSLALVCGSALARAIGSFFIGLNRPPVPTKMFKTFPGALAWSVAQGDVPKARAVAREGQ